MENRYSLKSHLCLVVSGQVYLNLNLAQAACIKEFLSDDLNL